MKILITGATGFIGRELIRSMSDRSSIACLSKEQSSFLDKEKVRAVICDLNDLQCLLKSIKGFDTVIHLAGIVNARSPKEFYDKNVLITKNLIKACKANGVKRFVFTSSAVVSSKVQGPYSRSKIEAERLVRASGLEYVILRPSLVYGEEDEKSLGGVIRIVKRFPIIPIIGARFKMQPVYVGNVAAAIINAAKSAKLKNKTYFIAGPKPVAFEYVVDLIIRALGKRRLKIKMPSFIPILLVRVYERIAKNPVIVHEQMARLLEDKSYDISAAVKDLNFSPMPIEEGIRRVVR